ncbi:hypothetical protein V8F06_006085 [Rhypophila decipiens]
MEKRSAARRRTTSDSGNDSPGPASGGGSGAGSIATSRKSRSETQSSSSIVRTSSKASNASGSSKASKPSRPFTTQSTYASPENWDLHRAEITTLYLDQDKTLREVREYMEKTHGFFATEKMYKTRIKKWALDKNNKMDEVVYMVRIKNQREAMGKRTEFIIRNRSVDWKDIERYMNRTPGLQAKVEDSQFELGSSIHGIVCRTPSPDPAQMLSVPPNLNATRYLTLQEEIMTLLRDYMTGAFTNKLWVNSPADNCYYGPNGAAASFRLSQWYEGLEVAGRWEADEADTVRLINIQLDQIRDIIRDEEPSLLSCFILFHHHLSHHRASLAQHVCPFVASMCEVVLGPHHPITRIWQRVLELPMEEFAITLERSAQFRYNFFRSNLQGGERNWTSVFSLCQYAASLSPNNPVEVERLTRSMMREFDVSTELRFQIDSQLMMKLVSMNIASGNYDTAAEMLERIRERIVYGEPFGLPYFSRLVSSYYRELAVLYLATGRQVEAAALLRKNYNYCIENFGPTAFRTMRLAISMLHYNIAQTPEELTEWEYVVNQGRLVHLNKAMNHTEAIVWTTNTAPQLVVQVPIVTQAEASHAILTMRPRAGQATMSGIPDVHILPSSSRMGMSVMTTSPMEMSIDPALDLQVGFGHPSRKSSETSSGSYYHSHEDSSPSYSTHSGQGLEHLHIPRKHSN